MFIWEAGVVKGFDFGLHLHSSNRLTQEGKFKLSVKFLQSFPEIVAANFLTADIGVLFFRRRDHFSPYYSVFLRFFVLSMA